MNNQPKRLKQLRDDAVALILKERSGSLATDKIENALRTLLKDTLERIEEPLRRVVQSHNEPTDADLKGAKNALRGNHHLRFSPQKTLSSEKNFASETVFEKTLAREDGALVASGSPEHGEGRWANQIPIWSGICGSGDRKTSVDIGYTSDSRSFLLYELKIASDHPLYAIVELITYAHGYLIVRKLAGLLQDQAEKIRKHSFGLLDANAITFSVIAPNDYYDKPTGPPARIVLSRSELEDVRATAAQLLQKTAQDFGFISLRIDMSLLQLGCKMPPSFKKDPSVRDRWLNSMRCSGSLRDAVLSANSI
jgi:hypothetical protein